MKKSLMLLMVVVVSLAFTACTYWTPTEKSGAFFDTEMKETVSFEESLSGYDRLEITVDLTVSGVEVASVEGKSLKYEQKANKEPLLASMKKSDRGNTLILTFKNETNPNLLTGTQNSETKIWIPSDVEVVWVSNVDVGDLKFDMTHLNMIEVDAETNVGKIDVHANEDFDNLTYLRLQSDVGDVRISVDGVQEALEKMDLSTNTGSVSMTLDGEMKHALEVTAKADVGSVSLKFRGDYEKPVDCSARASVGDVEIAFPKKHEVSLEAKTSEFTSKLNYGDIPFVKSQNLYKLDGGEAVFKIDLEVSIGDATLSYSK